MHEVRYCIRASKIHENTWCSLVSFVDEIGFVQFFNVSYNYTDRVGFIPRDF